MKSSRVVAGMRRREVLRKKRKWTMQIQEGNHGENSLA